MMYNSLLLETSNSGSNKQKRINQNQKHILYAAMAVNKSILESRSGDLGARRARKLVWKKVVLELNMAGPEKDVSQWRKVYTDLRLGMRKKWDKARHLEYILTEYERRVIEACGMIVRPGDEGYKENSAEDINNFLTFLKQEEMREETSIANCVAYLREDPSNTHPNYYVNANDVGEFITCQPEGMNFKEEFDDEDSKMKYEEEASIECISDDGDESLARTEEFREPPSVECISDDEVEELPIQSEIKVESPEISHLSNEEEPITPIKTEPRKLQFLNNCTEVEVPAMPRPMQLHSPEMPTVPRPMQIPCPEIPAVPSTSALIDVNLPRRKKIKNSTLKEIKKMHRNLLKESKKQTALLRKLVQGMQK